MKDNILKLKNSDGFDVEIEVLDIINEENSNKDYMIYRIKNTDNVLISIIN